MSVCSCGSPLKEGKCVFGCEKFRKPSQRVICEEKAARDKSKQRPATSELLTPKEMRAAFERVIPEHRRAAFKGRLTRKQLSKQKDPK